MNLDEQRLRTALGAVDPVDTDAATARWAAHEGSRRNRRNRALSMAGGLAAVVAVAALSTPLWFPDRGPATVATPSPVPTATVATPSPVPTATDTGTPTPPVSPSSSASPTGADRLITPAGIGVLRVGMSMEEGKRLGITTDEARMACDDWALTPAMYERYPGVWEYFNDGLVLAITSKPGMDEAGIPGLEYATAKGIRVLDSMDDVRKAYGASAVPWPSDDKHWDNLSDMSLPAGNIPKGGSQNPDWETENLLVRDGDRALVFLGRHGVIEYIMATTMDPDGRASVIYGC